MVSDLPEWPSPLTETASTSVGAVYFCLSLWYGTSMNFKEEYEARLRRLAGVTDDSRSVEVTIDGETGGGCDTCGYGGSEVSIEIWVSGGGYRTYEGSGAFGDLMRDLQEVEL